MNTHGEAIAFDVKGDAECTLRVFVQPTEEHAKVEQVRNEGGGIAFALNDMDNFWRVYNVKTLEGHAESVDRQSKLAPERR